VVSSYAVYEKKDLVCQIPQLSECFLTPFANVRRSIVLEIDDLHFSTFCPGCGTTGSLILFHKKTVNKSVNKRQPKAGKRNGTDSVASLAKQFGALALRAAGTGAGSLLGDPVSGHAAGAWLSKAIGMGDYKVEDNTLWKGGSSVNGVPNFKQGADSVRVCHREYLGDITGSSGFSLTSFALNPGLQTSFPWLSGLAQNFQEYRIHGMLFVFNSTSADALNSTNTALGTVVMAAQYNVNRANFASKLEMEGYEYSCSTKPSVSLIHPIECDPTLTPLPHLYIRTGAVTGIEDLRMYDHATFQLATVGMQASANLGELWVSYDIELFKPRVTPGYFNDPYTRISNGPYSATSPFGIIQRTVVGGLGIAVSSSGPGFDTLNWPSSYTSGRYLVTLSWNSSTALSVTAAPTINLTNLSYSQIFQLNSNGALSSPNTAVTTYSLIMTICVSINGYSSTGSSLRVSGGTLPGTSPSYFDALVVPIPANDSFI